MRWVLLALPVLFLLVPVAFGQTFVLLSTHEAVYGQQVTATGTLYRADTNEPLSGKTITLQISDDNATWSDVSSCVTQTDGSCSVVFTPDPGYWYVRFVFAGDDTFAPSTSNVEELNVLHSVELSLTMPSQVAPGEEFNITVSATVDGSPAELNVAIYRSPDGNEYNVIGYVLTTGGTGSLTWSEPATGTYYFYAYFEGNADYASAVTPVSTLTVSTGGGAGGGGAGGGAGGGGVGGGAPAPGPSGAEQPSAQPGPVQPAAPTHTAGVPSWAVILVLLALAAFFLIMSRKK